MGILDEPECQRLIDVLDRLQETEDRLFHFVKVRVDLESEREKRMALEKLQQINNEDEEAHQSQTLNYQDGPTVSQLQLNQNGRATGQFRDEESLAAITSFSHGKGHGA